MCHLHGLLNGSLMCQVHRSLHGGRVRRWHREDGTRGWEDDLVYDWLSVDADWEVCVWMFCLSGNWHVYGRRCHRSRHLWLWWHLVITGINLNLLRFHGLYLKYPPCRLAALDGKLWSGCNCGFWDKDRCVILTLASNFKPQTNRTSILKALPWLDFDAFKMPSLKLDVRISKDGLDCWLNFYFIFLVYPWSLFFFSAISL